MYSSGLAAAVLSPTNDLKKMMKGLLLIGALGALAMVSSAEDCGAHFEKEDMADMDKDCQSECKLRDYDGEMFIGDEEANFTRCQCINYESGQAPYTVCESANFKVDDDDDDDEPVTCPSDYENTMRPDNCRCKIDYSSWSYSSYSYRSYYRYSRRYSYNEDSYDEAFCESSCCHEGKCKAKDVCDKAEAVAMAIGITFLVLCLIGGCVGFALFMRGSQQRGRFNQQQNNGMNGGGGGGGGYPPAGGGGQVGYVSRDQAPVAGGYNPGYAPPAQAGGIYPPAQPAGYPPVQAGYPPSTGYPGPGEAPPAYGAYPPAK
jgi:hypothetical protein